jgi:hypothetical protein
MEQLAQTDPVAFLERCLACCRREAQAYRLTWQRLERFEGRLKPREVIEVSFRESPYSLLLRWREGAGKAERVLFVKGENNNKLLVRPNDPFVRQLMGDVMELDPDGPEVRQAARIPLTQFGFCHQLERELDKWKPAREQSQLAVRYLGEGRHPETDNQPCYHFHWVLADWAQIEPVENGARERTYYFDKATGVMVGKIEHGADGEVVHQNLLRDIVFNPDFGPGHFARSALLV